MNEEIGQQVFFGLSARTTLLPEGKEIADLVTAAVSGRLRNPKHLAELVDHQRQPAPDLLLVAGVDVGGVADVDGHRLAGAGQREDADLCPRCWTVVTDGGAA